VGLLDSKVALRPELRLVLERSLIAVRNEANFVPKSVSCDFLVSFFDFSDSNLRAGARSRSITLSVNAFQSKPEAKPASWMAAMAIKQ
jgi:hypothetical protein